MAKASLRKHEGPGMISRGLSFQTKILMVGTGGFEPPASCVSSKRSPPELRALTCPVTTELLYKATDIYTQNPKSVKGKALAGDWCLAFLLSIC